LKDAQILSEGIDFGPESRRICECDVQMMPASIGVFSDHHLGALGDAELHPLVNLYAFG